MTTTISVQEDTKERFDALRPEGAASADEFLGVLLDHYDADDETNPESEETVGPVDHLQLEAIESIGEQLDRIESSAETAEQRTGNIERTLEDLQR